MTHKTLEFIFAQASYEPKFVCFEICITLTLRGVLTLMFLFICQNARWAQIHEDLFCKNWFTYFSWCCNYLSLSSETWSLLNHVLIFLNCDTANFYCVWNQYIMMFHSYVNVYRKSNNLIPLFYSFKFKFKLVDFQLQSMHVQGDKMPSEL